MPLVHKRTHFNVKRVLFKPWHQLQLVINHAHGAASFFSAGLDVSCNQWVQGARSVTRSLGPCESLEGTLPPAGGDPVEGNSLFAGAAGSRGEGAVQNRLTIFFAGNSFFFFF